MSARLASAAASTSRRASITGPGRPARSRRCLAPCQAVSRFRAMAAWVLRPLETGLDEARPLLYDRLRPAARGWGTAIHAEDLVAAGRCTPARRRSGGLFRCHGGGRRFRRGGAGLERELPVSYTHLTLPTIYSV